MSRQADATKIRGTFAAARIRPISSQGAFHAKRTIHATPSATPSQTVTRLRLELTSQE
jgi:hypothetical protein